MKAQLSALLGCPLRACQQVSGGDICQAYRLESASGERWFLKRRPGSPEDFFEAEAHGLAWLAQVCSLRTPKVLAIGQGKDPYLLLEFLESARPTADFEERLGGGLAALHAHQETTFGLDRNNYIGPLAQSNRTHPNWADFYSQERLQPLIERAQQRGLLSRQWRPRWEALFRGLPRWIPEESPRRLHGDLWSGNLLVGPGGEPCLIDPSVYAGHREMDLAMMKLFGGFSRRVFQAYFEANPVEAGFEERVPLFQLYPLLVHLNLFGAGYLAQIERCLRAFAL